MDGVWIKRAAMAATAIIVVAGFAWALREKPALVDVATVVETPMHVAVREEGVTRVRDIYTVSAPIAGHLTRTVLEEGDSVVAGSTIVASIKPLDPPLLDRRTEAELLAARDAARSGVGIAQIELKRAETDLKLANEDLQRALKLYKPGIISERTLQKATSDVEMRQAVVDAARETIGYRQAELASAEARLLQPDPADPNGGSCCISLVAPIDGTVLSVLARSEQAVAAGMRISEIGDTSELEIVVDLLSADAVRIRPGTRATISDWGGDVTLEAVVRRVDPAAFTKVSALGIEEQRVNAVLDLTERDPRLGHGYRVFAEMPIWECETCLHVPISALFRNGNSWNVFVVENDRMRQTEVAIGRMNDDRAQVLDGLATGDVVVVHPGDTLADGGQVEIRAR